MQVLFLEVHSLVSVFLSTRVEGSEILAPRKPFLSSKYVRAAPPKAITEAVAL